jgi:Mannosyltransferase (PIG-V)
MRYAEAAPALLDTKGVMKETNWRGDLARATLLYLATRAGLLLYVWLTSQHFAPITPGLDRAFFPDNLLLTGLFQWDAFQYRQLIEHGYYHSDGFEVTSPYFPGFPLAALIVGKLVGSPLWGGIVVNHLASIGGAFLIARLARLLKLGEQGHDSEAIARETTLFWMASPLSFFFCIFQSEALFAFASVLSLWAVAVGAWPLVAVAGILTTGTRNAGVIVVLAAAILAWERRKEVTVGVRGWVCIGLMPLGLLGLIVYQHYTLGDGFAWVHAQIVWNRYLTWPWRTIADDWKGLPSLSRATINLDGMYKFQEVLALSLLAPLFFLRKRLNLPWALLALGMLEWVLPLTSHILSSAARYQAGNLYFALAIPALIATRPALRGLTWMFFGMVMAWYASTWPYGFWAT